MSLIFLLSVTLFCNADMLSPEGEPIESTFATFFRWVNHLEQQLENDQDLFVAAFGKPTFPINPTLLLAFREYWNAFPETASIPYSDTAGNWESRSLMAKAFEKEYNLQIDPTHIIYTIGGCGALQAAFRAIHQLNPTGKIVAILPFYPQYRVLHGGTEKNSIHGIDVTKTGFKLTVDALQTSLSFISASDISAFVFCDPNNPCGTTVGKEEWKKIGVILKKYPNIPIILDEAYREICFQETHISLLEAVPELASRIILVRSATKGLSAAGERMAVAYVPDNRLRNFMLDYITNISLHAPKSHQYAYSHAMYHLTLNKQNELGKYYQKRVSYMQEGLKDLNIHIKDPNYEPTATFYLLADLSCLKGKLLHPKAALILDKKKNRSIIETDQDIAYHLLIDKRLAITPLSFFGLNPEACLFRITCSDKPDQLEKILMRLKSMIHDE